MTTDPSFPDGQTCGERPRTILRILYILRIFTVFLWLFCTLLLWHPNPSILFGKLPVDEAPGFGLSHFLMFAVLMLFILRSWPSVSPLFWVGVLLFYAVGTELVQILIPNRTFEWLDIVQDALGIMLAFLVDLALRFYLFRPICRDS